MGLSPPYRKEIRRTLSLFPGGRRVITGPFLRSTARNSGTIPLIPHPGTLGTVGTGGRVYQESEFLSIGEDLL
jgi:hypothetical protein